MPSDRELFQSALDIAEPAARAEYLRAHAPDPDQRARVERLLAADAAAAGFLEQPPEDVPLTEYCDLHKLSIPERLALFMHICSAVQHAHQKGIIHRDLKPSNILVESHDDKPVPKVIDFGLAKAAAGLQLTEHSLFTAFGTVMGTPLYMVVSGSSTRTRRECHMLLNLWAGSFALRERASGFEPRMGRPMVAPSGAEDTSAQPLRTPL